MTEHEQLVARLLREIGSGRVWLTARELGELTDEELVLIFGEECDDEDDL